MHKIKKLITPQENKLTVVNQERMQSILASDSILMPQGLSREEKRQFILLQAYQTKQIES